MSTRLFHVTSVLNRDSIEAHGLDWTCMAAARGIAGSNSPELAGVFLCSSRFDAEFFVKMNNTGGPVDVWGIDGVDEGALSTSGSGFQYHPAPIPRDQITLLERSLPLVPSTPTPSRQSEAYRSTLTITLDDGTVLTDDGARAQLGPED